MKAIVGLGNPGEKYAQTRHNIGYEVVAAIAHKHNINMDKGECRSITGCGKICACRILLVKPLTFMNLSGEACLCLQQRYGLMPGDFLVIYDDVDLEPGRLRMRLGGGSGGHKGMDSIIRCLATENIPRLRVGVGHPGGEDVAGFVLSKPSPDEIKVLSGVSAMILAGLELYFADGPEKAMAFMNRKEYIGE